jgi:TetR/AcrR family transcriptional regulator, regulator of cefoperazone and chloramphenicol sensitivity
MGGEGERKGTQEKRRRLLEAAGEVFAERGFKAATIQEISQRASANIASINYHFRDKESLYHEVFRYALSQSRDRYLSLPFDETERRPAQRLRLEVHRSVKSSFLSDRAPWVPMLFFREILQPTSVFDSLVEENLKPYQVYLQSLARDILGAGIDQHVIRFSAIAVSALCSHFHTVESFIKKLYPDGRFGPEHAEELADLVATFLLGGIRALRDHPR